MSSPRRLRWSVPEGSSTRHPYRDTVIVYAGLAVIVVLVALVDRRRDRARAHRRSGLLRSRESAGRSFGCAAVNVLHVPWAGAVVTVAPSLDARVEALCGDLSTIRAPRGTELNARSWATEAPLRMLLNNLDREVAEKPEELVVYGGSGKAARSHEALRAIVRELLHSTTTRRCSCSRASRSLSSARRVAAPRVLIANSLLVPHWATWDEFRRLEAEGLTMFGQMTAGSWIYIGTQGILQGTYQTFAAAGEKHYGTASLAGRTILTAGLGGMGGAQPLAATLAGASMLCIEVDPARIERRLATRYLDEATESLDDALARVRAAAREGRAAVGRPARQCRRRRSGAGPPRRAASTSSPTRPQRTIRSPVTCRRGSTSRRLRCFAPLTPTSTCAGRGRRSRATSRACSSSSGPAAMFSIMATTCEVRPKQPA